MIRSQVVRCSDCPSYNSISSTMDESPSSLFTHY